MNPFIIRQIYRVFHKTFHISKINKMLRNCCTVVRLGIMIYQVDGFFVVVEIK